MFLFSRIPRLGALPDMVKQDRDPKGSVMTATFTLDGQDFIALNGGPHFKFTEAISFSVDCKTQEEVDQFWEKLSEGRAKITVRLAQRQIWFVMANCSNCLERVVRKQGCQEIKKSHGGYAQNGQARH